VNAAPTPEKGLAQATERFNALPQPFDLILLGMGDDGHTASLFPCAPQLQHAFSTSEPLVAMYPQTAPYGRISLSANALRQSRQNILLIRCASKQAVLQQALQHGPLEQMPVRLLWQAGHAAAGGVLGAVALVGWAACSPPGSSVGNKLPTLQMEHSCSTKSVPCSPT
jgi:6-phosphogluconolactonase/glucosamine-6-phosphate isomerase/deaminase